MAWDRKLIGILTVAILDYRPKPGRTSPALGWSVITVKPSGTGGSWQGGATAGFLMNYIKMYDKTSFFDVMSEVLNLFGRCFCWNR
jgi:hypothetical protein